VLLGFELPDVESVEVFEPFLLFFDFLLLDDFVDPVPVDVPVDDPLVPVDVPISVVFVPPVDDDPWLPLCVLLPLLLLPVLALPLDWPLWLPLCPLGVCEACAAGGVAAKVNGTGAANSPAAVKTTDHPILRRVMITPSFAKTREPRASTQSECRGTFWNANL